jgi:hypothetical protein
MSLAFLKGETKDELEITFPVIVHHIFVFINSVDLKHDFLTFFKRYVYIKREIIKILWELRRHYFPIERIMLNL